MTAEVRHTTIEALAIGHLDEDWAVPCEVGRKLVTCRGENPAEFVLWITPCSCCARVRPRLSCKPCLDDILGDQVDVCCQGCNAAYLPASTAIRLIEPLNRSNLS
jgi:hypothetical protein